MINRTMRLALLDDHETEVPFDFMYDVNGEETLDGHEAVSAVLELPNGEHMVLDLTEWVPVTLH